MVVERGTGGFRGSGDGKAFAGSKKRKDDTATGRRAVGFDQVEPPPGERGRIHDREVEIVFALVAVAANRRKRFAFRWIGQGAA